MATNLLSLLQQVLRAGTGVKTSTAPNSWATISLWRRFFELKDLEEEENAEDVLQALEEEFPMRQLRPIAAPEVVQARQEFTKEYYRTITRKTTPTTTTAAPMIGGGTGTTLPQLMRLQQQSHATTNVEQIVNRPNLQVPSGSNGENFMYLPQ